MTTEALKPVLYQIAVAVFGVLLGVGGTVGGQKLLTPAQASLPTIPAAPPLHADADTAGCAFEIRQLRTELSRKAAPAQPRVVRPAVQ